jgi:hypothetical protein
MPRQTDVVAGKDMEEAWNDNLMALVSCSRVHTWYFVVNFFHQVVEEQRQQRTNADGQAGIAPTLHKLCLLFALDRVHAEAALFLEYGYITGMPTVRPSLSFALLSCSSLFFVFVFVFVFGFVPDVVESKTTRR